MATINFIEATNEKQLSQLAALAHAIWNDYYPAMIGQQQVDYMLEKFQTLNAIQEQINQGYIYYLVSNNHQNNLGYFSVQIKDHALFLSKFYLAAGSRGRGLGKETMRFIEQLARENKCTNIWLTVNKNNLNSIKIYQKIGFTITGSCETTIGQGFVMDDYKMVKNLF